MELHVMEAHKVPQRMYMHFSHTLGIIAGLCQRACHGDRILPRHSVLIAHPPMMFLLQAGVQCAARRDAAGAGGIGVGIAHATGGQMIQIGGLHIRMPCRAHAVSAHLIRHDEQNVWLSFCCIFHMKSSIEIRNT